MKAEKTLWVIALSLIVILTLIDVGLYTTNRVIVNNYNQRLTQIQQQVNNNNAGIQRFIGQLKASKTMREVRELLEEIQ